MFALTLMMRDAWISEVEINFIIFSFTREELAPTVYWILVLRMSISYWG